MKGPWTRRHELEHAEKKMTFLSPTGVCMCKYLDKIGNIQFFLDSIFT